MKNLMICLQFLVPFIAVAQANRYEVVIDEVMADPSPPVQQIKGLPEVEFIELRNTSQKTFNLSGWKISDGTSTATISSNFLLLPDSFVIISSVNGASSLSIFGRSIGVTNFPSLGNDGDLIYLTSKEGKTIHALEYNSSWYQNAVKSNGGWTLEMIDTKNPCSGASNWIASSNIIGGSPGKKNSVDASNPDKLPPSMLRSYATDSINIIAIFDEPLDSLSAAVASNYYVSDDIGESVSVTAVGPLFNKLMIRLQHPLQKEKVYSITAKSLHDCAGNEIGVTNSVKLGITSPVDSFDVVVNEILFNPKAGGVDYVEIYNRSKKIIDLKDIFIANRTSSGSPGSLKQLSIMPLLLFPGEYQVITEDAEIVKQQYHAKKPDAFLELGTMPSFPDDMGAVLLLSSSGKIIDEVDYSEKWHFKLLSDDEGVALERIDYNKPSQNFLNWHSASTSSGYGTPTYQNSQFVSVASVEGTLDVQPKVFSPDNDGFNDFTTITYSFPEPGYVCNITCYDFNGNPIRYLVKNAICGITGYFRWDGLDDKNNKLPIGIYVMISEVFNLKGKTKKFKNGVVLAKRF